MANQREPELEHLFRRAGFGASDEEITEYVRLGLLGFSGAAARLLNYESAPDDVDDHIGQTGYVGITARGGFAPTSNITDARQRWLFRMVHTRRPLQEKMALFWHNHFATAYSKIAGEAGATEATRMLAAKPSEDPGGVEGAAGTVAPARAGQLSRLLVAIAQDPAMLFWLDGRTNMRARPQENFARELMELFTMGVGHVRRVGRVRRRPRVHRLESGAAGRRRRGSATRSATTPNQHDTTAKEFTFPIYSDGGRVIPARSAAGRHAGRHRSDRCGGAPPGHRAPAGAEAVRATSSARSTRPTKPCSNRCRATYYEQRFAIEPMVRRLLLSAQFRDPANYYRALFLAGRVRRPGAQGGRAGRGLSVNDALTPMLNMGQQLFEPPGRQRLGTRRRLVLERCHAGAHELRGAPGHEPEVQPARSLQVRRHQPGGPGGSRDRPVHAAAIRRHGERGARSTTSGQEARGRGPTPSWRTSPPASCT